MLERIKESISSAKNIEEAKRKLITILQTAQQEIPGLKVFYVIGMVTSDGPEKIEENLELLQRRSKQLRNITGGLFFSAADIFNREIFDRFNSYGTTNADYVRFWEEIVSSGGITDIVHTPRWDESMGAKAEHACAIKTGLGIHEFEDFLK